MAKQLNVNLAFTADTGKAKSELQGLQSQLQTLMSSATIKVGGISGIKTDIQGAITAAAQLKVQLENATNVKTGKLDLGKFSESLAKGNMSLKDYRMELEKLGPQGAQAFMSLASSISSAEVPLRRTNALVSEFATTLKNTARWQISSSILHGFMGTVQSAYGYAQDLNESLSNIRIVTGQNTDQMAKFADQANKAAKALSTTTTTYTDAALIYYQQGLSDQIVKERTDITVKMANVTKESADQVSSYMTAIWNNFDDGSKSLEHYADVMTALGAATASSTDEIAAGLEKFASIADMIGLSYEYATSALATVTATTRQSADVVGTAFKTIFARIQGLNLGETLDDETTLNKYSSALEKVGINIKDQSGNLKDMDMILNELGDKWKVIDKDQQVALAQTVAGVRQYNQLVSLMDNWDFFQKNLTVAQTSSGDLNKQADIYAESWEAAQKRVKAAAEDIYNDLLNDDFFITLLNGFEKVLTGVDDLIGGLGGLRGVLAGVSAILLRVFQKELAAGLNNAAYNLSMMTEKGRQKVAAIKQESWDQVKKMSVSSSTAEGAEQNANIQQTADLQTVLLANAEKMSEEELRQNQYLLDQHKILQQNAEMAAKAVDISSQKISDVSRETRAESKRQGVGAREYQAAQAELSKQTNAYAEQHHLVELLKNEITEAGINTTALTAAVTKLSKSKGFENQSEELKQLIASLENGTVTADQFATELSFIEIDQDDAWVTAVDEFSEATQTSIHQANLLGGQLVRGAQDEIVLAEASQAAAENMETLTDRFRAAGVGTTDLSRSLVATAQAISTTAMLLSSLGGLFDTLSNPDISGFEKLTAVLTTIAMVVPMVTASFNRQSLAQMATFATAIKAAMGMSTMTAAELAAAVAAEAGAAGAMSFGAALWTVLWPIGLVMLAVAALVAVVYGIVKAFQYFQSQSPEGKLKTLQEEADKASDAFDRVSASVTDVRNKLDELASGQETLADLTKGSEEWYEAVAKINNEILKLLETYPELSAMITSDQGVLNLSAAGMKYVQEEESTRLQAASNISLNAQKKVMEQQQVVNQKNFKDDEGILYGAYDQQDYYKSNEYDRDSMVSAFQQYYAVAGDSMFSDAGAQALMEGLYPVEVQSAELKAKIKDMLATNKQQIVDMDNLADQIKQIDETQFEAKLQSLGSTRTSEEGKQLLGIDQYSDVVTQSRKQVEESFGDWNNHINYKDADAEMQQIKDFMKLQGDNVEYVAQQRGKLVIKVDGEEIKYSKDEVYDALAELYSSDELKTQLQTALSSTLGTALGGIDLSEASLDDLNLLDNFKRGLETSLKDTDLSGSVNEIFKNMYDAAGGSAENLNKFVAQFSSLDFTNAEVLSQIQKDAESLSQDGSLDIDKFTESLRKMNEAAKMESMTSVFENAAKSMGLDDKAAADMQDYAKNLMDIAEESADLSDELATSADSAADLAIEITRMNKGIETLAEGFEDWNSILKKSSKSSDEYNKAMSGTKDALSDVLDVESDMISDSFVADHLDEIAKAAKGNEDAIDSLRSQLDEEIILKVSAGQTDEVVSKIQELSNTVQEISNTMPEIEVGATLQDADFLAAANKLVSTANMTADDANTYFAGIGYEPLYSQEEIPNSASAPNSLTKTSVTNVGWEDATIELPEILGGSVKFKLPSLTTKTESVALDSTEVPAPVTLMSFSGSGTPPPIRGFRKKATGGMSNYSSKNAGGKSPSGKGGGGKKGGGGGKKGGGGGEPQKKETKKLDDERERYHVINAVIEDLARTLDDLSRAKDRAWGLDKLKYIDAEIAKTEELIKAQKTYINEIKSNLSADKSAIAGYGAQFDANGNISNYDTIVAQQVSKYNKAVNAFNKNQNEDAFEAAEKAYEEFKKVLDKYEETNNLLQDQQQTLQDRILEELDKKLEKIKETVSMKVSIREDDIEYLEYQLGTLEDIAFSAARSLALVTTNIKALMDESDFYTKGISDILALQAAGASLTSDQIDTLREYKSSLMETNNKLLELRKTIEESVINSIEEFTDKIDKSISRFDTYSSVMSNYANIVELSGRATRDSALLIQLSTAMVDNSISKLTGAKEKYDALVASQQSAQENLLKAQGSGDSEATKYWTNTLEDISIKVEEAQDEMQQNWADALTAAADKFDKVVEITIAKLEDALSSFTDLDTFSDVYSKAQSAVDRFLSDNEKIYELNKLNRDINKSIDNTANLAAKTKLKEVLEEINKLQSDNVTMSKYDLDYLQAKYNLKVAEIALEEAQNAKNQVRLTRDSEGNWGYTYTADQTKIDEAQQSYENNLNNLQKLSEDYIKNMSDQIIQNQQEMAEALANIDKNRADYTEEVARITEYYLGQDLYLRQEMDKAVVNSGITYNDTILGQIDSANSWQEAHQNMANSTNAAVATMNTAYIEWKNTVDNVMKAAGTSSNDFTQTVKDDLDTISNKSNELEQTLEEDSQNMTSYMDTLMNKVSEWQRTYGTSIQAMIAANEALIASLNEVIAAQGGMSSLSGIDDYSVQMAAEYMDNGESPRYIQLAKDRDAKMDADPSVSNISNAALLTLLQKASADPKNSAAAKYVKEVISGSKYFDLATMSGFDTGGYTGDWGPDAKLAALHEKEIVLNEADTTNFLKAIDIVRSISSILDQKALLASLGLLNVSAASTLDTTSQAVEQDVTIHAEFPNVTDRNEIEAAFNNLIGTASQYANRK
ncbi:MAG: phage tail tape measure protein [Candidatus Pacebacteria bacterium]|nr:phage tail tape measure protein [Candidatus Paceibacterota bacterium]